jgi:DNA-binding LacI/PurR family transcriptional regulator
MIKCVKCGEVDAIAKSGIVRGKQRYYCSKCDYYFTLSTEQPVSINHHKRHPATILDIARELHISKSTVSRALHGHSDINEQTRKAVLETARKLEYQPNLLAYGLAKNKSMTIGIIVPEFINSFFPFIIIGAQEVANPAGYHVLICQSNESYQTEIANTNVLLSSRVDGLLVSLTGETPNIDHFKKFERAGIPVVYFNRVCKDTHVSKVIVDDYEGAFKGVVHLIENGCRRIAHIAGPANLQMSQNRLRGYLDALAQHGIEKDSSLIIDYDLNPQQATECAKRLFDLPLPPDGLFAVNDPAAIAAMLVAKERAIKIPDELAVLGFSNEPTSALIEPGLTTLAQPMADIGRTAISMLFDQIDSADDEVVEPETRVLKTTLIVRGSSLKHQHQGIHEG